MSEHKEQAIEQQVNEVLDSLDDVLAEADTQVEAEYQRWLKTYQTAIEAAEVFHGIITAICDFSKDVQNATQRKALQQAARSRLKRLLGIPGEITRIVKRDGDEPLWDIFVQIGEQTKRIRLTLDDMNVASRIEKRALAVDLVMMPSGGFPITNKGILRVVQWLIFWLQEIEEPGDEGTGVGAARSYLREYARLHYIDELQEREVHKRVRKDIYQAMQERGEIPKHGYVSTDSIEIPEGYVIPQEYWRDYAAGRIGEREPFKYEGKLYFNFNSFRKWIMDHYKNKTMQNELRNWLLDLGAERTRPRWPWLGEKRPKLWAVDPHLLDE
jgi:hypothetical protein